MKILIDMSLSPEWVVTFAQHGITAVHWSTVGNPRAEDSVLMDWARTNDYVVFTHDLDFGAMLALTQAESPSVIQVRTQDVSPTHIGKAVIDVMRLILQDEPDWKASVNALLSEQSLAEDWNLPEEDEAWSHLQPAP
jgi:predicted nuclease of predicted toxin-antitoxin system